MVVLTLKFLALAQVQGGGSGIGTFAIQLAKAKGCRVFCTACNKPSPIHLHRISRLPRRRITSIYYYYHSDMVDLEFIILDWNLQKILW